MRHGFNRGKQKVGGNTKPYMGVPLSRRDTEQLQACEVSGNTECKYRLVVRHKGRGVMIRQTDKLDRILDKELCKQKTRFPTEKGSVHSYRIIPHCIYLMEDGTCELPRCVRKVGKNGRN